MRIKRESCAACRFSRRCCPPDCQFAPYFPANEPQVYQNVHSLYGTEKVLRVLKLLNGDVQKEEAMISIKYESYIRKINPVHGCYGVTIALKQQLVEETRKLQYVRFLLEAHRRNNKPTQVSLTMPSTGTLPVSNEIVNDQSVGALSDGTLTQTMNENERNANEVASRITVLPPNNVLDQEITNADLMRILEVDEL